MGLVYTTWSLAATVAHSSAAHAALAVNSVGLACLFYLSSLISCLSFGESCMFWTGVKPAVPVDS